MRARSETVARPAPPSGTPGRGSALVLAGALLWGTTGTARALGPDAASALSVGATRLVLGGLLLCLVALLPGRPTGGRRAGPPRVTTSGGAAAHPDLAHPDLARRPAPRSARVRLPIRAVLAGAAGVAAYQVSFFAAVDRAGVALGTAVAIGSSPVFTGLIEWALDRRPPARRWWAATGVAATGVAVLAGPSSLVPLGVVLALGAGASYATYAVASKRLLDAGLSSRAAMAWVFGGGGLAIAPLLLVTDLSWLADPAGLAMLVWLAVATTVVAYLLFGAGLRLVAASTAATLSLAEPLTAAVLGVALLGERPTAAGVVGGALVLCGLLVLLLPRGRGDRA